jgi:hypothetical protein
MSPAPRRVDAARKRFDRAVLRSRHEQTALLDWLARSSGAAVLRGDEPDLVETRRRSARIDLRTDIRRSDDLRTEQVVDDLVIDLRDHAPATEANRETGPVTSTTSGEDAAASVEANHS